MRRPSAGPVVTASLVPPAGTDFNGVAPHGRFKLSPDGRKLAFIARSGSASQVWVRPLASAEWQSLARTDGATNATWSPDGRSLAFVAAGKLHTIGASGGPPSTIAGQASLWGLAWGGGDVILFVPDVEGAIFRTSTSGTTPSPATTLDAARGETRHGNPSFLPDGRKFVFTARRATDSGEAFSLHLGSLDGNPPPRLLLDNASGGLYAAGHLLFLRGSTLMARPFDIDRLDFSGEEVTVAETIALSPSLRAGALSVSDIGLLAYQASVGTVRSQLIWHNRDGRPLQKVAEPLDQTSLELSPDGTRALVSVALARAAITRCRSQPPVATSRAGAARAKRSST
jgi:hypothetical protein